MSRVVEVVARSVLREETASLRWEDSEVMRVARAASSVLKKDSRVATDWRISLRKVASSAVSFSSI